MGQTISKPQTVLKQVRPFKKTGQTTGQTILEQAGQTIQTMNQIIKTSQIVNLAKNKNKKKLLNVNRAVAKADPQDTELLCVHKYFFLNRTIKKKLK